MGEEKVLVISEFDSTACNKFALLWYIVGFLYGWVIGWVFISKLNAGIGFLFGILLCVVIGGAVHSIIYFVARNNEITLTNYKITGTYSRRLSLNIPIDSVSSVSKIAMGGLCVTCAGNIYKISFVSNREEFCSKLNELLNKRTQKALNISPIVSTESNYEEIVKLKQLLDDGIITQEEFNTKKKQILGL